MSNTTHKGITSAPHDPLIERNKMKRWEVEFSDMWGGYCKSFFFKSSAFKHAEDNKDNSPIVTIYDRLFKKTYDIKKPKKYPIPIYDDNMCFSGKTFGNYEY